MSDEIRVRHRPHVLRAWQYSGDADLSGAPEWLKSWSIGWLDLLHGIQVLCTEVHKSDHPEIHETDPAYYLHIPVWGENGRPYYPYTVSGDWIIYDGDTLTVLTNEEFEKEYERV